MYRLVEAYRGDPLEVAGEVVAAESCLLEDDDLIRVMVHAGTSVAAEDWHAAHASGAAAIYVITEGRVFLVSAETFMDRRTENAATRTYVIPAEALRPLSGWPDSYLSAAGLTSPGDTSDMSRFVHLHAHSEMSALDGYSTVQEMVDLAVADGQPALAVTDHGYCASHPDLHRIATAAGVKPIYGIEAYFVADRTKKAPPKLDLSGVAPEHVDSVRAAHVQAQRDARDYHHLILWAQTDEGLRNLWAMSTASFTDGLYYKPRLDWEVLERFSDGVMASTACLRGPLAVPLLRDDHETASQNLSRLLSIFGDRLYAEIHTNGLDEQRAANLAILDLAAQHGVPPIAVVDSHYPCREDHHAHKVWLASQMNKDLSDDEDIFAGHHHYHLMGAAEVKSALDYLPPGVVSEAMANTVAVADRCDATLGGRSAMPIFTRPGNYASTADRQAADADMLVRLAMGTEADGYANWHAKCVGPDKTHPPEVYMERFEREMDLLTSKGFIGYYLMVHSQVSWAKAKGCLVGPGRGSGPASLVAYLLGITVPDPVENGLLFERFLTPDRDDPPDFDVDYPSSWRDAIQDHEMDKWGEDHTVRVGTNLRLKSKGVFQSLARIYSDEVDYRDFAQVANIIDRAEAGAAGLGVSWDELWSQHGDELEPYRTKYPTVFDLAERMRGRLKSYGRHPAGLVISPDESLADRLPMRASDKSNQLISQFDMDALGDLGYIKFDILTLRNLDTLQECIDLIRERHGSAPDVYGWASEYDDPQVWDALCEGHTLGVFQVETSSGTRLVRQFQPRSLAELADVITIVRPGPDRSGLTAAYLRRRAGFEEVSFVDDRLAEVLASTQGVIIYQEQVMEACQRLAGYSLAEANNIRKILSKKKVEQVEEAGIEFVRRATAEGMERDDAEHLWEQLGEFSRYSFNRSHAFCYAIVGFWTAWFKVHYPIEFLTAALSTVKKDRVPEFVNEARRMGYSVQPPDINESGIGFTASGIACRYGFEAIDGIGEAAAKAIVSAQPYASVEDFIERSPREANRKVLKLLARVGAFDRFEPNRRALVERLEWEDSDQSGMCVHKSPGTVGPGGLPCTFDWSAEPVKIGKSGRPLKAKPLPKRCTKACRQFTASAPPDHTGVEDYSDAQVRSIERELLGVYLSSTPFDLFTDEDREQLTLGSDLAAAPVGRYQIAATVSRVKPHQDRNGAKMAFLGLYAQDQEVDAVVFSSLWADLQGIVGPDALVLAEVAKNARGVSVVDLVVITPGRI